MTIIGICGFINSGKGTVADILVKKHNFTKISFADPLKDAVSIIFDWPRNLLEGDTEESRNFREKVDEDWSRRLGYVVTPRFILQKMGTEAVRDSLHPNLWVESAFRRMENQSGNFVIPDVRFKNEIESIKNAGGFIIRVLRGEDPEWYETAHFDNHVIEEERHLSEDSGLLMKHKYPNIHPSEWKWIGSTKFDYLLPNTGPIGELEANINYMLTIFKGPIKIAS